MDEPRTHYQLSFTARQALLLFVALLGALAVAYVLGLLTGLAGRDAAPAGASAASTPAAAPTAAAASESLEIPRPQRGIPPGRLGARPAPSAVHVAEAGRTPAAAAPASTPSPGLQLFDDEGGPPAVTPRGAAGPANRPRGDKGLGTGKVAPAAPASVSGFWVQALSASSEREARHTRERLVRDGFATAIVPGWGPTGEKLYRVRVGPFGSREEAERAAVRLKAKEKLKPWIVPPGK